MSNKVKIGIVVGVVLVALIVGFLLLRGGAAGANGETKATSDTGTDDGTTKPAGDSPHDYTYTIPRETDPQITDWWSEQSGLSEKIELDKDAFDRKVYAIIEQIWNDKEGDWYKRVIADTKKYAHNYAGYKPAQAVYEEARGFVAGKYYYPAA